jgi:hypothetical protein
MEKKMKMKLAGTLLILVLFLFSGCTIFQPYARLSPLNKAKVSAETLSTWYQSTHIAVEQKYAEGDKETRVLLRETVNPKMNQLKPLIIKYDKLILLWSKTNAQPEGIAGLVSEIEKLIFGVIEALK